VPVTLVEGSTTLHGEVTIYYCEAINESLCFIEQLRIDAPVVVGDGESTTIRLDHRIVPPEVEVGGLG
jgi:hypothetical protein